MHMGFADSGHYYSFIQDRNNNRWFEFNDSTVRKFNIQDLDEEAFGADHRSYDSKDTIKNAYMLIYERQRKIDEKMEASLDIENLLERKESLSIAE